MSDAPISTPPRGQARSAARRANRPAPNFAARRMLVTTVAITAIVAFAVIGWQAVSRDGGSSRGPAGTWNELALVDRTTGAVTVLNDEGEPDRVIVGRGRVTDVHTHGDRLALIGPTQIVLQGGDADAATIAIEGTDTVTPIRTADSMHLVVGNPAGGNVSIIDVTTGMVLDIGAIAEQTSPLLFAETLRWSADGSSFAVADAANFQTILIDARTLAATFFPDQPVALNRERIATSQIVGQQADIALFDRSRKSQALVPTPIPAGGVMVGNDLLMVAIDGGVYRIKGGSAEAERLGEVAVPSGATVNSIHPTFDGERLVVVGTVFEAVIDLDGRTVFATTFTSPVDAAVPEPTWSCLPVGGAGAFHSIVALDDGEQLADLSGLEVTGVAGDGCTVIGERDGITEIVGADGTVSLGDVRAATLGPDGRTVIRTTTTGRTELVTINDDFELSDPIDLTASIPTNAVVAFLN